MARMCLAEVTPVMVERLASEPRRLEIRATNHPGNPLSRTL
jgi:hypothetical protein